MSIAIVGIVTAVLFASKLAIARPHDPAFFYLVPLLLVAIRYGTGPALAGLVVAFACADYFLYEPLYTLSICSKIELGDLVFFSILALLALKFTNQLLPAFTAASLARKAGAPGMAATATSPRQPSAEFDGLTTSSASGE